MEKSYNLRSSELQGLRAHERENAKNTGDRETDGRMTESQRNGQRWMDRDMDEQRRTNGQRNEQFKQ